jgi:hypothetical protein
MGLGAPYTAAAVLERGDTARLLVIDYDVNGIAELLCRYDYIKIFNDTRFFMLIDPAPEEIEKYILDTFQPALHDGIRALPLRARTIHDEAHFAPAADAVKTAVDKVASDYSVQAVFGKRWFSNIVRNVFTAEKQNGVLPPVKCAAICAAGPSLDLQLDAIARKRKSFFLISTDTALPALFDAGLAPDAVISIDCQHISCYHFMKPLPPNIPLLLDLSSPPLLASRAEKTFFFSGGHPLSGYINRFFRRFPTIDTSGGNVTFAALSLAETLGASRIEVYGADFSYPKGKLYARSAYIYPYFHRKQNRFNPAENCRSSFLYGTKSLTRVESGSSWYYETRALATYRKRFECKSSSINAAVLPARGEGAPVNIFPPENSSLTFEKNPPLRLFGAGKALCGAAEFLDIYRKKISALPPLTDNITNYQFGLSDEERMVFTTLLPAAAAIKYREPSLSAKELLARVKNYCAAEICRLPAGIKNGVRE